MRLSELFKNYQPIEVFGNINIEVKSLVTHTDYVKPGSVFFVICGEHHDGHDYVKQALDHGASIIVSEDKFKVPSSVVLVQVDDVLLALSRWSAVFYASPAKKLNMHAVTGTNGKTTIASLIYQIICKEETIGGLIGTLGYFYAKTKGSFGMTTPLAHDLQSVLKKMHDSGVKTVAMEVSSHGLELKRVEDIRFNTAIFTNLTQDHMDFHKNFESYYLSKKKLFNLLNSDRDAKAIINIDDEYGQRLCSELKVPLCTYGIKNDADYKAEIIETDLKGTRFKVISPYGEQEFMINLIGEFNVYNSLAAIAWSIEGGRNMEAVAQIFSELKPAPGRIEIINSSKSNKTAVVDYAHTPAALENVLMSLRSLVKGRLICIFGCGGDRDRTKRPLMGKVAGILADVVYVTSDNPRSEDPMSIILDIEVGIRDTGVKYFVFPDRGEAIREAIALSEPEDCILIAGKGDEDYQIIGQEKIHFSDREFAQNYLQQ